MKRILTATVLCTALSAFTGCNDQVEPTLYNGPEYVMFQDTLNQFYVSEKTHIISVPVSATKAVGYDRTFGVEAVATGSTAIEDRHFSLKSHNVTIKAGELASNIEIETNIGTFEKIDSMGTILRLIMPDALSWDLYGLETKVSMEKYCDFNMDTWFENEMAKDDPEKYNYANYILHATFPFSESSTQFKKLLVKIVRDPNNDHQLIIKGPFQKGVDLKIRLEEGDPDESTVTMLSQKSFFGLNTLWVEMRTNALYRSSYNTCKRYMELYIESYMEKYTPFGVYPYYLEWITERHAEEIRNNGF